MVIKNWVRINERLATRNNVPLLTLDEQPHSAPEELYRQLQHHYPKFFKMDALSKWAWLGAENLTVSGGNHTYEGMAKEKVAVVIMTSHGCMDADKKYKASLSDIPSPALFVYTLPNIMLGEICIRHGFKGEQACMVSSKFNTSELHFWVSSLMEDKGMDACLCGWVDANGEDHDVCLFWITKSEKGYVFTAEAMQQLYMG